MSQTECLRLFAGYGIELEYMIVDRDSLDVRPVTDLLLEQVAGTLVNEVEMGPLCWSNELVLHVVELKTNGPARSLDGLASVFQDGVARVNQRLQGMNARLLGTAMHPWMDPHRETRLWPHDNSSIYATYNRIFDCRGHGWSNLQSMHINLPFCGDEEFGRLHAAIRLVLPLLAALAASSPIYGGTRSGLLDSRLEFYRHNQQKIPQIAGQIVPEPVFSRADYEQRILQRSYAAIAPYDPQGILQDEWLNSRGAIARFERGAIEIRLLDLQECPLADLAIAALVCAVIRALCRETWSPLACQQQVGTGPLAELLVRVLQHGGDELIAAPDYLACFGLACFGHTGGPLPVSSLWQHLYTAVEAEVAPGYHAPLRQILEQGSLAQRILRALPQQFGRRDLCQLYRRLADCLEQGVLFAS
ncbi:carboxylate-amine ligase [Desulfurivibrio dismutans]|uniref:carboxylate-amine ligase n=1 Tax=Desulfurivibrio dismutans TaxID=1398908 RepID=UPI0023DA51C8|nr:glutamate-cysteine ligase family protein [Desulfurivibrio alkaliphilus]MDF1614848.1 glutamate-cysteine ligase family protein [Desulfurivibrio alkaliphilus]